MKPKLLMLQGLPASGKSTHAKELVKEGWKRVSKDDLRAMIDSGKWSREKEVLILESEKDLVKKFLAEGLNVVVDDTNFVHKETWKRIADEYNADFDIKFFDTPLAECIERDSKRGSQSVGKKVIQEMYNKYLKQEVKPITPNKNLDYCYMFDIDGTLAVMGNRSPYDWQKVGVDEPNPYVRRILNIAKTNGDKIFILSGRDGICSGETIEWLDKNNIQYDKIFMRQEGDTRSDDVIKEEIYREHIEGKYNVLGVFDDRLRVCRLWYRLGLPLFRVGDPDADF